MRFDLRGDFARRPVVLKEALAATGSPSPRGRRPRVRTGDVLIVIAVAGAAALLYNHDVSDIIGFIYNKYVGLVLLLLILEFLWLKSGDRTRVYFLEIEKLRARRRKDEELLKRSKEMIELAIKYPKPEEEGRPGAWMQRAKDTVKDIEDRL